jgi:hypothetical protein
MTPAAHRHSTLRFWLAVAAAVEAGALIAIVPTWTPGRAAIAGVALGLGAGAALIAVILMGTTRPIGRWLGAAITVALAASCLAPMAASSMADPTQARIPDLTLSVTCTVSPDAQSVTAQAEFSWQRLDLWPAGAAGESGTDSLVVSAQLPEWIGNELNWVQPAAAGRRLQLHAGSVARPIQSGLADPGRAAVRDLGHDGGASVGLYRRAAVAHVWLRHRRHQELGAPGRWPI